ncbi:MAG TPA: DUF4382 domain-containing protein [Chitinophagaceae bacterium]|jgi:hypothetical protein|nr:DUF4382 domain-containing protein [Chitinophagaceae bacterium]
MKTKHFLILILSFLPFIFSCKKEKKTSPIQIYLTDDPAVYDSVYIHIKSIEVNVLHDSLAWIPLDTKDTIINLLNLHDGVTMLTAQGIVPQGLLKEVRFILGNGNTVVVNGISYPMQTPSAETSGLKLKIDKKLNEVFNAFIFDFDASQSIVAENGTYRLEPVIRLLP